MRHPEPPAPLHRVRTLRDGPIRERGAFVLYWMTAFRRPGWNHALDRAVAWAAKLDRPLLVLEPLRAGYAWASDRTHAFVLEGMAHNAAAFAATDAAYHPYVEPEPGAGRGLLEALARESCLVVADDSPVFFLPRMLAAAATRIDARLEAVDSNGLLPLRAAEKVYGSAHELRRFLQRTLPPLLDEAPSPAPLARARLPRLEALPREVERRWPRASAALLATEPRALAALPIDHSVPPVPSVPGGAGEGTRVLEGFLAKRLARYSEDRNEPDEDATSGLAPYLHFGHASAHQVWDALVRRESWDRSKVAKKPNGSRNGFWGLSEPAEAFVDELVTWRELGLNMASKRGDEYERWESLPAWARATLDLHAKDARPEVYTLEELEAARTHDPLWNAAQTQLRREGRIHNYLRMLWGKKVLQWMRSPREALEVLVHLNNKWALDGRDPNSYSGILWCFGRYDRPWGPEREIFGKVRYMTSENTARKLTLDRYLARYAAPGPRAAASRS